MLAEKLDNALYLHAFSIKQLFKHNTICMKTKTYTHLLFAFCGILAVLPGTIGAQSASFSQYYTTRMHLNPALAGEQPGTAVTMAYREQWTNVPGGLRTVFASFEQRCKGVPDAIGLSVLNNTEGEGFLNTAEVNAHYARLIPFEGRKARAELRLGMRVGWGNKRIDWPRLVFSDQLHPVLGQILPQSPGAVPILQSKSYFSNGIGATLHLNLKKEKKLAGSWDFRLQICFVQTNRFNNWAPCSPPDIQSMPMSQSRFRAKALGATRCYSP